MLRERLPHLLTMGPYAVNCKTGPAIWLRCMIYQSGANVPVAFRQARRPESCTTSSATVPVAAQGKPEAFTTFGRILQETVYFNPYEPIEITERNLPHWRQPNVTYFVTFRLADALPAEKLRALKTERETWLKSHPEPHSAPPIRRNTTVSFPSASKTGWTPGPAPFCFAMSASGESLPAASSTSMGSVTLLAHGW